MTSQPSVSKDPRTDGLGILKTCPSAMGRISTIVNNLSGVNKFMIKCPECGGKGLIVEKITVANHAKESAWPLGDDKFYFCDNPECEVVYFSSKGRTLKRDDVKTRVTFKEKTSPRPLCYCRQVTEEDVIRAIENGATTFEEVAKSTGIGGGGHCDITNPAGRCCSRNYRPFIEKELRNRA
jgi:bacterioferritin-associated ferredoxin